MHHTWKLPFVRFKDFCHVYSFHQQAWKCQTVLFVLCGNFYWECVYVLKKNISVCWVVGWLEKSRWWVPYSPFKHIMAVLLNALGRKQEVRKWNFFRKKSIIHPFILPHSLHSVSFCTTYWYLPSISVLKQVFVIVISHQCLSTSFMLLSLEKK